MFDLVYNFPVTYGQQLSSSHDAGLPRDNRMEVVESKPVRSISGSQFNYDNELQRTFVEFFNPDTGEVITRFPFLSSYLVTDIEMNGFVNRGSGTLLDAII